MKQKFVIQKNASAQQLIIREFSELDKDTMTLLCEEVYPMEAVVSSAARGKVDLLNTLRTMNLYPPKLYADQLVDLTLDLLNSEEQVREIAIDDVESLQNEEDLIGTLDDLEDEADLGELLEDEFEDNTDDSDELLVSSSLKIADDEDTELDEEL